MRIDSYNSLLIATFCSQYNTHYDIVNKIKNEYYYHKFLEKGSYKYKSNTEFILNEFLYIINAVFQ